MFLRSSARFESSNTRRLFGIQAFLLASLLFQQKEVEPRDHFRVLRSPTQHNDKFSVKKDESVYSKRNECFCTTPCCSKRRAPA